MSTSINADEICQQLLQLSTLLLQQATEGHWNALINTGTRYYRLVEALIHSQQISCWKADKQPDLTLTIAKILKNEARVKQLLQKHQDKLLECISQTLPQKSINKTYRTAYGNVLFPDQFR